MQIDIRAAIRSKNPKLGKWIPEFVIRFIGKIMHLKELNDILLHHQNETSIEFATRAIQYINVKFDVFPEENIPKKGRYIIVSNHPLGGVDGLALISILGKYREDLKFPVNDLLMQIEPLKEIFIPINKHGKNKNKVLQELNDAFASDNLILYFPAGLCSRKENGIIRDLEWKKTVVAKAKEQQRDIIPLFFGGKNKDIFYRIAHWRKRLHIKFNIEMLLLPSQIFYQKNKTLPVIFGEKIPYQTFDHSKTDKEWAEWLKTQVYELENKFLK